LAGNVALLLLLLNSGIRLQPRHHATAMMGNPGLLQELPYFPFLLPQGSGGDREHSAGVDGTACGLIAKV
jgi:hypothetical protein